MKDIDELKKIAVLIDAENAQCSKLKAIIDEISGHGHIIVKRAYGDWANEVLKNWKSELNKLAIQPIQQFSYTAKKNSSDARMIIDAMDLLYTEKFDAFALVSSDSDFTSLASRLRESEIFVFGIGENKTPIAFRNTCDNFIFTENLDAPTTIEATVASPIESSEPFVEETPSIEEEEENIKQKVADISEVKKFLDKAWELYQDDSGFVNVSSTGTYIKRLMPDFDTRSYGFLKLPDLIKSLSKEYEMKKYPGKGKVNIIAYKPK